MSKVQGRERLLRKLATLPPKARELIGKALQEGGDVIARDAKSRVPKRTGHLLRSIKVVSGDYQPDNANVRGMSAGLQRGDPKLTVRVVAGSARAWYARLVEFGTAPHIAGGKFKGARHPGARARPFFFPAYRANKRRVSTRVGKAIKQAVKEIAGR